MTTQPPHKRCDDDVVIWPDSTFATLGDVRRGEYDWKSDDYEIIPYDAAEALAVSGIEIE